MNHMKRMWGHYLALVIIITILVFPISWIYKLFQNRFGGGEAYLALAAISMGIIVLGVLGGNYANKLHRFLRDEAARRTQLEDAKGKPVVLEVFGVELYRCEASKVVFKPAPAESQPVIASIMQDIQELSFSPKKHRGKKSRFPQEKIRKAILNWERRSSTFPAMTLEEFLEEEFGSGPDGILLVASSTFYDWRRHVLKEIEEQRNHP